jgi:CRISPR-associated protein Cas2
MLVLVSYDVNTQTNEGKRRLRHIAKICENYGQRVQNSVFECLVDFTQWRQIACKLVSEMDEDQDSLRFYFLGNNWRGRVEHHGIKPGYDPEGPLIF